MTTRDVTVDPEGGPATEQDSQPDFEASDVLIVVDGKPVVVDGKQSGTQHMFLVSADSALHSVFAKTKRLASASHNVSILDVSDLELHAELLASVPEILVLRACQGGGLAPLESALEVLGAEISEHLSVLGRAFEEAWDDIAVEPLRSLEIDQIVALGRAAGAQAATAARWHQQLGESLDTSQVTEALGISRQALDSRKRTGSVLALPGSGTSHYPAWQFDVDGNTATVRPVTLRIVTTFREYLADVSPFTIAAWARSPQPELDECTPADWIMAGSDDGPVVLAARRAAHLETQ